MTTDRELLEKAAKAAGIVIECDADKAVVYPSHYSGGFSVLNGKGGSCLWNPLTDDGDCARLEATLKLDVLWFANSVGVHGVTESYEEHDGDRQAARRRACVRAAAAMGEQHD